MDLPKYHETFIPILEVLKDGKKIKGRDLTLIVRDEFYSGLSSDLLAKKTSSGEYIILNRVSWGKSYLKMGKFVSYPQRGFVQITEKGKTILKKGSFTLEELNRDSDYINHKSPLKSDEGHTNRDNSLYEALSPQDMIDSGVSSIEEDVKADL